MKALWKEYIVLVHLGLPIRPYSAMQKSGATFVRLHEKDNFSKKPVALLRSEKFPMSAASENKVQVMLANTLQRSNKPNQG